MNAEFYKEAGELVRQVGLRKGSLWEGEESDGDEVTWDERGVPTTYIPGSPVCTWGAMYVVMGRYRSEESDLEMMREVDRCGEALTMWRWQSTSHTVISRWNDAETTSQADVVDLFSRFARELRGGS